MVKVLVVEDEASIREMIALNLRLAGMEAVEADSAEAALPLLEQKPGCDAAILDVMLPGMNGFSLCETIRRTDQKIGIIILSAKGQEQDLLIFSEMNSDQVDVFLAEYKKSGVEPIALKAVITGNNIFWTAERTQKELLREHLFMSNIYKSNM